MHSNEVLSLEMKMVRKELDEMKGDVKEIRNLLTDFILDAKTGLATKEELKNGLKDKADKKFENWVIAVILAIIIFIVKSGLSQLLK